MIEEKCKVCGHPLSFADTFCPECGFERHVLPTPVSREVEEYEDKRIREYLKKLKLAQEQKKEIEKLNSELQTAKSESVANKQEIEKLSAELEEVTHQASANSKDKERELSRIQKEYATIKVDKENIEKQLRNEQDAHNRTRQQVKELLVKIERLSIEKTPVSQPSEHPKIKQPVQHSTQRTVIGKVIFISDGRTESVELYSGLCRVVAPQWTNIEGEMFEINGSNGLYRLFDIKGNMCDRHGKPVPSQGATTRNNDVFTSGDVTIRFTLPEIDYDSLY